MGNKYGASALTASWISPNFDKYLEKVAAAGNSIDDACKDAVDAVLPIIETDMKGGAERHRRPDSAVYDAIETKQAKVENNFVYGEVGIDMEKHPEAKHAVYQEYGDGHSPQFPDPFVRPAIDDNRAEAKRIQRDVLKKKGVPID